MLTTLAHLCHSCGATTLTPDIYSAILNWVSSLIIAFGTLHETGLYRSAMRTHEVARSSSLVPLLTIYDSKNHVILVEQLLTPDISFPSNFFRVYTIFAEDLKDFPSLNGA